MKKYLVIPILSMYVLLTSCGFAQNDEAMMKAWQESMTPGPMHQMLAKGVGEWKADITMWMDPSQPATKSVGTTVTESLFDGKYFQSKFTGTYMDQPMYGQELFGYDNVKKEFFSIWIDNMGTGVAHLKGAYDEASKTINYSGTGTDPMGGEYKMRETVKHLDDYTIQFEMFMEQNGTESKAMEIIYTKVK